MIQSEHTYKGKKNERKCIVVNWMYLKSTIKGGVRLESKTGPRTSNNILRTN